MLGFSHAPEMIILLVIAFMVFGPEKLPEIARGAGRGLREFRRMSSELQQSLGSTLQEPLEQIQQVRQEMQQQVQDVTRIANETLTQSWAPPVAPTPAYVPQPEDVTLAPADLSPAAAEAQHDLVHVADVPAARPPVARRPSIALHAAALAPGAGGRLTLAQPPSAPTSEPAPTPPAAEEGPISV